MPVPHARAGQSGLPLRSSAFVGMHAQYEHSPPTSSRSTTAALSPPTTTRSARFSPTGHAPMITASYTVMSVPLGCARGSAETDGGDQEENGAAHRVTGDTGQHCVVPARHHDERRTDDGGKTAAEDHRGLTSEFATAHSDDQLHDPGDDGPAAEDPEHGRDPGRRGESEPDRGQGADHDGQNQPTRPRRPGV